MALAARFSWTDAHGVRQKGQGTTRDIGPFGVSVLSAVFPAAGSLIELEIALSLAAGARRLEMQARGRVLRSGSASADGRRTGFAAVSEGFHLFREEGAEQRSEMPWAEDVDVTPEGSDE